MVIKLCKSIFSPAIVYESKTTLKRYVLVTGATVLVSLFTCYFQKMRWSTNFTLQNPYDAPTWPSTIFYSNASFFSHFLIHMNLLRCPHDQLRTDWCKLHNILLPLYPNGAELSARLDCYQLVWLTIFSGNADWLQLHVRNILCYNDGDTLKEAKSV